MNLPPRAAWLTLAVVAVTALTVAELSYRRVAAWQRRR